ncbi:MAG: squalene/phytoene synthase family protein [Nitrospirae bacterium]|nr:squalene/phytoene synthase family protein [Nitrospirota bacterium]
MKSNFFYSFFLLPPEERNALLAFYAFCREIDDQVDLALSSDGHSAGSSKKMEIIREWRSELIATFNGKPAHPLTVKLKPFIEQYRLSHEYFDEILNGMEMDILQSSYATFDGLKLYCYRVASVVGLICMEIFQDRSFPAKECAIHLGTAFQMTNILRDIFTDLKKGRIYLPEEDLVQFSYSETDLGNRVISAEFARLVEFEIARTKTYYDIAERRLNECRNPGRPAIEVMLKTYFQLLLKIERNIRVLDREEIALSLLKKAAIAGEVWFSGKLRRFKTGLNS